MSGVHLREFEELVLLAVMLTDDEASGVTIQRVLESEAGRGVSLGAIYTALDRLARKGMVRSWLGEPTPVRGGRRKRYYKLTPSGFRRVTEVRRIREGLWAKIERGRASEEAVP